MQYPDYSLLLQCNASSKAQNDMDVPAPTSTSGPAAGPDYSLLLQGNPSGSSMAQKDMDVSASSFTPAPGATAGHGPRRVGILASECYFPSTYVSQAKLEEFDGIPSGKYQIGLGQHKMAFTGPEEDINSMMMSALDNLMSKYGLSYKDIGRLEVGTETIVDKSKSSKTSLMQMFSGSGNTDVLGVTNKNACYGGTASLLNTIDWIESSAWDGRYGVVLCGDIAVYEQGPARPTGGAGVVALLIGPEAPLVFENSLRASHFEDAYDFYKPNLSSEYPTVDGALSNSCYLRSVDQCYQLYAKKFEKLTGEKFSVFDESTQSAQHYLFHQPYTKLVQKSFGRLLYNDLLRAGRSELHLNQQFSELGEQFKEVAVESSYTNRDLDKACVNASKTLYQEKCFPYTEAGRNLGNSYTGSLYFGLLSLIANSDKGSFDQDRVLMFSYGSGLASTLFSLRVEGDLSLQRDTCNLKARLEDRVEVSPEVFTETLKKREEYYTASDYSMMKAPAQIAPGAFHLTGVDAVGRRTYAKTPSLEAQLMGAAQQAKITSAQRAWVIPSQKQYAAASMRGFHTRVHNRRRSTLRANRAIALARRAVLRK